MAEEQIWYYQKLGIELKDPFSNSLLRIFVLRQLVKGN